MKNLFKIFVVVAGIAAAFYACEPKKNDSHGTSEDSLTKSEAPAPDSLGTAGDTATSAQGDTSTSK